MALLRVGDILGDYRVLSLIGSGGMGTVYQVEHRITRRIEAMKTLRLGLGSDPDVIGRFEKEIQVQARLHHPNIASLYSAVRAPETFALLMEFVEGQSLDQLLAQERIPLQSSVEYARQVLDALAHAHSNGVIHCDVSPGNIVVTPAGTVKLTDFGLARAASDLSGESPNGVPVGSPWHMSPEQIRGNAPLDARTDIYAAASVIHKMLTGATMFDAASPYEILLAHLNAAPRPIRAGNPEVPVALERAVLKALSKAPEHRFQTAVEFRDAIQAPFAPKATRRPPLLYGAASVAAVVLVVFAGFSWIGRTQPKPAEIPAPVKTLEPPATAPPPAPVPDPAPEPEKPRVEKPQKSAVQSRERRTPVLAAIPPSRTTAPVHLPAAPEPGPLEQLPLPASVVAGPDSPLPAGEEVKQPKSGNRFVRAIGKLNPFRKSR